MFITPNFHFDNIFQLEIRECKKSKKCLATKKRPANLSPQLVRQLTDGSEYGFPLSLETIKADCPL